jgi:hypothetical protein
VRSVGERHLPDIRDRADSGAHFRVSDLVCLMSLINGRFCLPFKEAKERGADKKRHIFGTGRRGHSGKDQHDQVVLKIDFTLDDWVD